MLSRIPITVIIATKNEAHNMTRCLEALLDFDEIIVFDSNSTDETVEISQKYYARIENFKWNNQYPKKRQYALDNLDIKNDYVFFVDADEILTRDLVEEIRNLNFSCAGYFVKGRYVGERKLLKHGLKNNKLCLFHKNRIMFPVIDDADIEAMGEIEGHYQPVLRAEYAQEPIGQLEAPLIHNAYEEPEVWLERHQRYAQWEAYMIANDLYPKDPNSKREKMKIFFRQLPFRNAIAFVHSYFLKFGFLDGVDGFKFARSRAKYYQLVNHALKTNKA